MKKEAWRY